MGFKEYEGGMELSHVVKMDVAGSIPGFVKNKAAARLANTLQVIVGYIRDGIVPAPIF